MKPVELLSHYTAVMNLQFHGDEPLPLPSWQWIQHKRFTPNQNHMNTLSPLQTVKRPSPQSSPQQIAALAYQLYEEKGSRDGQDVADWLEAEKKLNVPRPTSSFPTDGKAQPRNSVPASSNPNARLV
jgi:Protein of unknown function (DUF2934)